MIWSIKYFLLLLHQNRFTSKLSLIFYSMPFCLYFQVHTKIFFVFKISNLILTNLSYCQSKWKYSLCLLSSCDSFIKSRKLHMEKVNDFWNFITLFYLYWFQSLNLKKLNHKLKWDKTETKTLNTSISQFDRNMIPPVKSFNLKVLSLVN